MENNTPVQTIKVVQYNLFDFMDGKPKAVDEVIGRRLAQGKHMTSASQVALLNNDHLGSIHPVCPECGSKKCVKNGFHKRNPIISGFGKITLYVQRYECRKCGHGFSVQIDGIVEKGHWYCHIFREMVNAAAAILKYSSRKIQQMFLALFGISPSHQTIENWLQAEIPRLSYSGYYCYDEQVVRMNGKKGYRLTLFDVILNVPVAEEVTFTLNGETVSAFLKKNLFKIPVNSITTDDRKYYRKIVKKYKVIHQLCGFHFVKKLREDAEWYFKRKSLSDSEKIRIALCVSSVSEAFRSSTIEEFEDKLENVLDMMYTVPPRIRHHLKRVVKDFDLYAVRFHNPFVKGTTSQVENYYTQTDPEKMKRRYKTPQGLTQALSLKAPFWIVRNGFISEEESLQIARKYLGKRFNETNIHKVFSRKKKHVLKYLMGDLPE